MLNLQKFLNVKIKILTLTGRTSSNSRTRQKVSKTDKLNIQTQNILWPRWLSFRYVWILMLRKKNTFPLQIVLRCYQMILACIFLSLFHKPRADRLFQLAEHQSCVLLSAFLDKRFVVESYLKTQPPSELFVADLTDAMIPTLLKIAILLQAKDCGILYETRKTLPHFG